MNIELWFYLTILQLLPRVRGWGRLKNLLMKIYNRKYRESIITKIFGFKMELDPMEHVDSEILFTQTYEKIYFDFIKNNISDNFVFIDCGANTGYYSLLVTSLTKSKSKVLSIEACPENFQRLIKNINLNNYNNITPIHIGLSDKEETLSLNRNKLNKGMNTFQNHENCNDSVVVQCNTLLYLLNINNINKIDLLKIDIEGYEIKVLRRFFLDSPSSLHPKYILIEDNLDYRKNYDISIDDLMKNNSYNILDSEDNNKIYHLVN